MEYAIGAGLALAAGVFGTAVGFDRERSFYAVVLVIVGTYYVLFAVAAASTRALYVELVPLILFAAAAALGFRSTLWIVVAGLAMHGAFDLVHAAVIDNPGVPAFWPGFCMAYDVVAAAYLAVLLVVRRTPAAFRG